MTTNPVTEAVTHMLHADTETDRCLAIGELLDRLVRATGQSADKIGPLVAAMLLLWRGDHSSPDNMVLARRRARAALETAELSLDELTWLISCGRMLTGIALELQGKQLLAEAKREN